MKHSRRKVLGFSGALSASFIATSGFIGSPTRAAEQYVLRLHHYRSASSASHQKVMVPWARELEEATNGQLVVEIFPAMQLGGTPQRLFDQVREGVVDLAWTVPGYTPGRFLSLEAFELPFMAATSPICNAALADVQQEGYFAQDLKDVHPLVLHVHEPGSIHMRQDPVYRQEDLAGRVIRAPGRRIGEALRLFEASPVFMPITQLPESLARGVLDGTVIPFEVVRALKLYDFLPYHTEIMLQRGFYTLVLMFAMNKKRYLSLPDHLQEAVQQSALSLRKLVGEVWQQGEQADRQQALDYGQEVYQLPESEVVSWYQKTRPVIADWLRDMQKAGRDGEGLLDAAEAALTRHGSPPIA